MAVTSHRLLVDNSYGRRNRWRFNEKQIIANSVIKVLGNLVELQRSVPPITKGEVFAFGFPLLALVF